MTQLLALISLSLLVVRLVYIYTYGTHNNISDFNNNIENVYSIKQNIFWPIPSFVQETSGYWAPWKKTGAQPGPT